MLTALLLCALSGTQAARTWIDVTSQYVTNPSFDDNTSDGWTAEGFYSKQDVQFGCMEFWNGTFTLSQQLSGLPDGQYRLRVQGFYRTRDNNTAYQNHQNNTENITAFLYAGEAQTKLHSVYDESFGVNLANNCWGQGNWWEGIKYFPNGMASAHEAFEMGCYENLLEFSVVGGSVVIGISNATSMNDNWCIFDHFRLEYFDDVDEAAAGNLLLNEVMAANVDMFWSETANFDGWAELYNPTDRPVMLGGCYLSDDANQLTLWRIPDEAGAIAAHGFGVVWFDDSRLSPLHAPFKLDTDGATLYLSNSKGELMATVDYPKALPRTSYARTADGTGSWALTAMPTPRRSNGSSAFASQQLPMPVVDKPSQLFRGSLTVEVQIPEGATLRYTTDGTTPTPDNGNVSTTGRFTVNGTTNYRFRLFRDGWLPSNVLTCSYIATSNQYTIPVVSIVADNEFLYGNMYGVMTQGTNGKPGHGQAQPCNWNMDWERPVSFVYFAPDGRQLFCQEVNLEMCGGWSRAWSPHSFKLKASKVFGTGKTLDYPFFEQKPFIRNRTLQLRNGGNDTQCRFKDAALETILFRSGIDLDVQSYQPVIHYINGKFIGLLNMREPNNKHFVFANRGWDDDEIDLFEMDPDSAYVQKCGTDESFLRWYDLSKHVNEEGVYDEICAMVDVDEYVNYMAALLYLGTTDWPQNNLKGYFKRDGGRWRFVSFDLDFAFNTSDSFNTFFGKKTYTFEQLYDKHTRITAEIKMVTILQNMLANERFRRRFIDVFCLMGGSVFEPTRAKAIIDELANNVAPMMKFENGSPWNTANQMTESLSNWMPKMMNTLKRYSLMKLQGVNAQTVHLSADAEGATLLVNGVEVPYAEFTGRLFAPVRLRAEAPVGYTFSGWKDMTTGQICSAEAEIDLPEGLVDLTATFRRNVDDAAVHPVVNEVSASNDSYVNDYFKRADWVELYNPGSEAVDVEGMYLSNDPDNLHLWRIEKGGSEASTVIPAHGYLVVWCDKQDSQSQLHAPFKLGNGGATVSLTAADDSWTSTMLYPSHSMDQTVARYPDGSEAVYVSNVPTIGRRNVRTSYLVAAEQQPSGIVSAELASAGLRLTYVLDRLVVTAQKGGEGRIMVSSTAGQPLVDRFVCFADGRTEVLLSPLQPGCYVATLVTNDGRRASCKLLSVRK